MAEVFSAAEKREWDKVEVRRHPLDAVLTPSVASLPPGAWSVDPCSLRHTSDSALPNPAALVRRRFRIFSYFACSRSSMPVTAPTPVARAQSQNFSPPPSLAIAVFRNFLRFGTLCGCASGGRDGGHSEPARSTLSRNPRGLLFCFRVPVGYWGTPVGPIPSPRLRPCTAAAPPRCTRRRGMAIGESSDY